MGSSFDPVVSFVLRLWMVGGRDTFRCGFENIVSSSSVENQVPDASDVGRESELEKELVWLSEVDILLSACVSCLSGLRLCLGSKS